VVVMVVGKRTVVYVGGTFDGVTDSLHDGHKELFMVANKIAGKNGSVIAAVNSDEFVMRHKGITPSRFTAQRCLDVNKYLLSIGCNHGSVIVVDDDSDQTRLLNKHRPDYLLHGEPDWSGAAICERYGITFDWLKSRGITLLFTTRTTGLSSTLLRGAQ
jgi:glycerol-3-phosphate cytidylyltransferase-like family protein